jgi:hypothetical protein
VEDTGALQDGGLEQDLAMAEEEWRCAFPVVVKNHGTKADFRRES